MSEIVAKALDMAEARLLTDEVRADATAMWEKLRLLYEGQAHVALGYSSWGDYCAAEFDVGSSQAYRLLDAGRVRHLLGQRAETHSPIGGTNENAHSPRRERSASAAASPTSRPWPADTNGSCADSGCR